MNILDGWALQKGDHCPTFHQKLRWNRPCYEMLVIFGSGLTWINILSCFRINKGTRFSPIPLVGGCKKTPIQLFSFGRPETGSVNLFHFYDWKFMFYLLHWKTYICCLLSFWLLSSDLCIARRNPITKVNFNCFEGPVLYHVTTNIGHYRNTRFNYKTKQTMKTWQY